jgi:hypothetical protein
VAQKAQIWAATGREVNVLELRLQDWLEPAGGPEGAVEPQTRQGQTRDRLSGPRRGASCHRRIDRHETEPTVVRRQSDEPGGSRPRNSIPVSDEKET